MRGVRSRRRVQRPAHKIRKQAWQIDSSGSSDGGGSVSEPDSDHNSGGDPGRAPRAGVARPPAWLFIALLVMALICVFDMHIGGLTERLGGDGVLKQEARARSSHPAAKAMGRGVQVVVEAQEVLEKQKFLPILTQIVH